MFRRGRDEFGLRRFVALVLAGWTVTVAGALRTDLLRNRELVSTMALTEARSAYRQDMTFRRWAAGHGGVYVPTTSATPPNPYLANVPERDVTTPSGRPLTLVNPAYMMRQMHELAAKRPGVQGHITSLNPRRPQNAPDAWERAALERFEQGQKEYWSVADLGGQAHLRYIAAMYTEESCLKCHAQQGYRVGDVRGGISVSVPLAAYQAAALVHRRESWAAFLLLWLVGVLGILGASRALGQRMHAAKAADRALAESLVRYRTLFDQAAAGVIEIETPSGTIRAANHCFGELLGPDQPATTGANLCELVDADDQAALQAALALLHTGQAATWHGDLRLRQADGTVVWTHATLSQASGETEARHSAIAVLVDITARREAELARTALETQLAQARRLEAVGRLAGGVAHDFNNVMAAVLGYAELLADETAPSDPHHGYALEIIDASQRAANLTRQLLTFSRRQVCQPQPVRLDQLLSDLGRMLERLMGEDVALEMRFTEANGVAMADPAQLEQVVMNLCVNARDAMPDGGLVFIEVDTVTLRDEELAASSGVSPGEYVRLSVSDSGCGMTAEVRERIFEPFFTTKPDGRGTGLGLATVLGIVQQHNGGIHVYSEPGRGTTFRILLPRTDQAPEVVAKPRAKVVPGSGQTVLVLEDNASVRRPTCLLLDRLGYQTVEAQSQADCLQIAQSDRPIDMLLTDVIMPGMNGREVYRQVSQHRPDLPVVYMSGYAESIIAHHGVLDEGVILVSKPFSEAELSHKLAMAFERVAHHQPT